MPGGGGARIVRTLFARWLCVYISVHVCVCVGWVQRADGGCDGSDGSVARLLARRAGPHAQRTVRPIRPACRGTRPAPILPDRVVYFSTLFITARLSGRSRTLMGSDELSLALPVAALNSLRRVADKMLLYFLSENILISLLSRHGAHVSYSRAYFLKGVA